MRVLLSIKPEFAKSIFNGSKKYEYRKTIFRRQDIDRVLVYVTTPIKLVVGEFFVGNILHEPIHILWEKTEGTSGISKNKFIKYFENRQRGYAIEIKNTKPYDYPLSLNELMLSSPPQSFRYLNGLNYRPATQHNLIESSLAKGSNKRVMHSNLV